jgi:segregation and condensation protein A
MNYQVVLPVFEGPLDLLLHLIDSNELDIYNIPIAFITGQYMDYLNQAQEIDLTLSGDFVLMAGTLLTIKARMLLPKRTQPSEADGTAGDPRDELVEKLLEYRLYKEKAAEFKAMEQSQSRIFFREVDDKALMRLFPAPNPIGKLTTDDLSKTFMQILESMISREKVIELPKESVTVQARISFLLKVIRQQPGGIAFRSLLEGDSLRTVVTTFMALLELLHRGRVWARQKEAFGEIYIFYNDLYGKEGDPGEFVSC